MPKPKKRGRPSLGGVAYNKLVAFKLRADDYVAIEALTGDVNAWCRDAAVEKLRAIQGPMPAAKKA